MLYYNEVKRIIDESSKNIENYITLVKLSDVKLIDYFYSLFDTVTEDSIEDYLDAMTVNLVIEYKDILSTLKHFGGRYTNEKRATDIDLEIQKILDNLADNLNKDIPYIQQDFRIGVDKMVYETIDNLDTLIRNKQDLDTAIRSIVNTKGDRDFKLLIHVIGQMLINFQAITELNQEYFSDEIIKKTLFIYNEFVRSRIYQI